MNGQLENTPLIIANPKSDSGTATAHLIIMIIKTKRVDINHSGGSIPHIGTFTAPLSFGHLWIWIIGLNF
jgi:hypothetical protein